MKKILYILLPAIALTGCGGYIQTTVYQPPQQNYSSYDTPTDQVFYDELSPYGNWIDYPDYGYVWAPADVGPDFRPYATNGYWVTVIMAGHGPPIIVGDGHLSIMADGFMMITTAG